MAPELRRVWIWEGDDYTYHVSPDDTAYQYGYGYFTDQELADFARVERDFAWMQQKIAETIAHPDTRMRDMTDFKDNPPIVILSAEHFGVAVAKDGILDIGGLQVPYDGYAGRVDVYVRRRSSDLSIIEIQIAHHDGLAQEELDQQNEEAEAHPLGVKEYWRERMVGHYTTGADNHLMTDADFESEWS